MGHGRREQADSSHERRHHYGTDTGVHPQFYRRVQRMALVAHMLQVMLEDRDQQHAVLDTDAEQRDETDTGRNTEVGTREMQGGYSADDGERHIQEHQTRVLQVAEHHKKKDEDPQQADGNDFFQPFRSALLVLEIALPHHGIPFLQGDHLIYLALRFGDGAAHIASAYREFQRGIALIVVAEDEAGTRLELQGGYFLYGHL